MQGKKTLLSSSFKIPEWLKFDHIAWGFRDWQIQCKCLRTYQQIDLKFKITQFWYNLSGINMIIFQTATIEHMVTLAMNSFVLPKLNGKK